MIIIKISQEKQLKWLKKEEAKMMISMLNKTVNDQIQKFTSQTSPSFDEHRYLPHLIHSVQRPQRLQPKWRHSSLACSRSKPEHVWESREIRESPVPPTVQLRFLNQTATSSNVGRKLHPIPQGRIFREAKSTGESENVERTIRVAREETAGKFFWRQIWFWHLFGGEFHR